MHTALRTKRTINAPVSTSESTTLVLKQCGQDLIVVLLPDWKTRMKTSAESMRRLID